MIRVTCALIEKAGKVLITQRSITMSQPLLWEFPGGKIEVGETEEACLIREIKEELNITITCLHRLTPSVCTYPNIKVELIPFVCSLIGGEIKLLEHAAYRWVEVEELMLYDWSPADIPIVEEYIARRAGPSPDVSE